MSFLSLIFGKWVYIVFSLMVKILMQLKGINVGKSFYIERIPILRIDGNAKNITIGNNVKCMGQVEIKVRENGKIIIGDNCKIDRDVRLVSANNATLSIGNDTNIGAYSIFNCGVDVTIGEKVLISGFVYIQSSNHGIKRKSYIKDQEYTYGEIILEDDVWIGSHVSVLAGVKVGKGAVVGSKAVVTKNVEKYSIVAGVPANSIGKRQ